MFKKLLTALAVAGATSSAFADSVSGEVNLEIQVPEVLVLYHWDKAKITFSDFKRAVPDNPVREKTADITTNEITVNDDFSNDVSTTSILHSSSNEIKVILANAWAVRSLTESGTVTLGITNPATEHVLNSGATPSIIRTAEPKLISNDAISGSPSDILPLPSQWAPIMGSISFKLDLSAAKKSGLHKPAGGTKTFTLTLTGATQ